MNDRNQQIIKQLRKCDSIQKEILEINAKGEALRQLAEESKETKPEKKTFNESNYYDLIRTKDKAKGKPKKLLCIMAISLIVVIVFSIMLGLYYRKQAYIDSIAGITTPTTNEIFLEWKQSWSEVNSFYDLEEGWEVVQNDMKRYGLDISWEDVCEIWENGSNNRIERFESRLEDLIRQEGRKDRSAFNIYLTFVVIGIFTAIYCWRSYKKTLAFNQQTQKQLEEIKKKKEDVEKYNKNTYTKLLKDWKNTCSKYTQMYEQFLVDSEEKLNQLKGQLSEEANLLYTKFQIERCKYGYAEVADVMENDYVTYDRALQICKENEEAEERRTQEFLRNRQEELHRKQMERYAHEQVEATKAHTRALKEQEEKAKEAARERCSKCARRSNCNLYSSAALNCNAYIPK